MAAVSCRVDVRKRRMFAEAEKRRIVAGHVLDGRVVEAVASRKPGKETIFWLPDVGGWAVVHLTWTKETKPDWPSAVIVDSWDNVLAELVDSGHE